MKMTRPIPIAMILAVALAACEPAPEGPPRVENGDDAIACSIGGTENFSSDCRVERSLAGGTLYLIVRHPDGAF
ncbi:MAG: hypothetical protein P8J20_07065, partial [Novosphingobium sp.]|nr:hypothetical protein [Novosphingobium sp.]